MEEAKGGGVNDKWCQRARSEVVASHFLEHVVQCWQTPRLFVDLRNSCLFVLLVVSCLFFLAILTSLLQLPSPIEQIILMAPIRLVSLQTVSWTR